MRHAPALLRDVGPCGVRRHARPSILTDNTNATIGEDVDTKMTKTEEEWRELLTPHQYEILRRKGTEPAFSGEYAFSKADGTYRCAACGSELFDSDAKFDSGTGWPSFTEPAIADAIELRPDNSLFMRRTEVVCRRCESHLGHVFDDGPGPGGQRYCINSAALAHEGTDAPDEGE